MENQKKEVNRLKQELNTLNKKLNDLKSNLKPTVDNVKQLDDVTLGCIIKIQLNLNDSKDYEIFSMGRKQFKDKYLASYEDKIAYIDMEKNSNKILIRCKSSQYAKEILMDLENFSKSLLEGEEENKYFEKIISNRDKKIGKKERKEKLKSEKKVNNFSFKFKQIKK